MKYIKYLFVLIFIIVFILFDNSIGYTNTSPLYTHFTYMFQHAGIMHLIINSLSFIGMFRTMEAIINRWFLVACIVICSFTASFFTMYSMPTVGASSMIYTMIGLFIGIIIMCDSIKKTDTRKYLLFILCVFISLSISFIKTNSNLFVHLYSLVLGFIASIPISIYKNNKSLKHTM